MRERHSGREREGEMESARGRTRTRLPLAPSERQLVVSVMAENPARRVARHERFNAQRCSNRRAQDYFSKGEKKKKKNHFSALISKQFRGDSQETADLVWGHDNILIVIFGEPCTL